MGIPCHLFSFPVRPWRNHRQSQENDHGLIEPRDGFLFQLEGAMRAGAARNGLAFREWTGTSRRALLGQNPGTWNCAGVICGGWEGQGMGSMSGGACRHGMPGFQGATSALGAGRERREASARFKFKLKWCRERESNSHSLTRTGF